MRDQLAEQQFCSSPPCFVLVDDCWSLCAQFLAIPELIRFTRTCRRMEKIAHRRASYFSKPLPSFGADFDVLAYRQWRQAQNDAEVFYPSELIRASTSHCFRQRSHITIILGPDPFFNGNFNSKCVFSLEKLRLAARRFPSLRSCTLLFLHDIVDHSLQQLALKQDILRVLLGCWASQLLSLSVIVKFPGAEQPLLAPLVESIDKFTSLQHCLIHSVLQNGIAAAKIRFRTGCGVLDLAYDDRNSDDSTATVLQLVEHLRGNSSKLHHLVLKLPAVAISAITDAFGAFVRDLTIIHQSIENLGMERFDAELVKLEAYIAVIPTKMPNLECLSFEGGTGFVASQHPHLHIDLSPIVYLARRLRSISLHEVRDWTFRTNTNV
jgi:hypothetical protein